MQPEALILIGDDVNAQKLVAAWPAVDLEGKSEAEVLADVDGEIARAWSECSGVRPGTQRRLHPVLIANGICKPDGTVAELAWQYVRKKIAEGLGRTPK